MLLKPRPRTCVRCWTRRSTAPGAKRRHLPLGLLTPAQPDIAGLRIITDTQAAHGPCTVDDRSSQTGRWHDDAMRPKRPLGASFTTQPGLIAGCFTARSDGRASARSICTTRLQRNPPPCPGSRVCELYDPAWERTSRAHSARIAHDLAGQGAAHSLWKHQGVKCPVCGQGLTLQERWHMHHVQWGVYGGSDALYNRMLLHANCHRQIHSQGLNVEKAASRERR